MLVATTICPALCTPDAAAQLQPIPYACGAQRALFPVAVYPTDVRQTTDLVRCASSLNAPLPVGAGHNKHMRHNQIFFKQIYSDRNRPANGPVKDPKN